ncbi:hypothetical protein HYH03_007781 [Edaphochlamys debaryana]|uniref:NAD(P)H dehydrogenase (quinone) n=1 Tax=Edaphochlamys debaryana TaxID=47281 RepID=A0A835Y1J6_9CHLO|nr:hypothetical protein HYH03_007781 [Edaphochlamys debaryana]|eukprot:KAG2494145.1 hypothetical protein HYH03_007781 [Edaphochlamys debaryana]
MSGSEPATSSQPNEADSTHADGAASDGRAVSPARPADGHAPSPSTRADATPAKPLKVFLIFYSTYGHILKLAETYKEALEKEEGVEVAIYQVSEVMPAAALAELQAPPKSAHPVIDPHALDQADAFVFGFPTWFGMMPASMQAFFDATGFLWQRGALHGKPASLFTSNMVQSGGQETSIMTAVTQLAHHGMIFVPAGYAAGGVMFGVDEAKGGSPWGGGTLAGDNRRDPSEAELAAVRAQAWHFAAVARNLAA